MTICISAICTENNEEHIVFAVDHMITTGLGQFEHSINKYNVLNENVVGMMAGNALLMDYFFDFDYSNKTYVEIQSILEEKFKKKRLERIQKEVLDIFSIDSDFVRDILKGPIKNDFQSSILTNIARNKLNTAILIMGFEGNKARISEVSDTWVENYDQINFHTIGSGSIQARNTLLFQNHSKEDNLRTTLYNVYKAKKNFEVMQGVGKETDIGFFNKDVLFILDEGNIKILDEIYNLELSYGKEHKNLRLLKI